MKKKKSEEKNEKVNEHSEHQKGSGHMEPHKNITEICQKKCHQVPRKNQKRNESLSWKLCQNRKTDTQTHRQNLTIILLKKSWITNPGGTVLHKTLPSNQNQLFEMVKYPIVIITLYVIYSQFHLLLLMGERKREWILTLICRLIQPHTRWPNNKTKVIKTMRSASDNGYLPFSVTMLYCYHLCYPWRGSCYSQLWNRFGYTDHDCHHQINWV